MSHVYTDQPLLEACEKYAEKTECISGEMPEAKAHLTQHRRNVRSLCLGGMIVSLSNHTIIVISHELAVLMDLSNFTMSYNLLEAYQIQN